MLASAVLFGLLAVFVAQAWLNHQAERLKPGDASPAPVAATKTVVVASQPLRFGHQLSPQTLREVAWPEGAVPTGTFTTVADLLAPGKRIVLYSIEPNEPILASKITGPGQKGTLSAILQEGMKAVTVRVNDVEGVAGFVLPGDHVDVLMTRNSDKNSTATDLVLQNIRVLAVDQIADNAADKPTVARAVTLEVDTGAAQRLSLAATAGSLSLALRKAGEQMVEGARRITLMDLDSPYMTVRPTNAKSMATITVTRSGKPQDYNVPAEGTDGREANGLQRTKQ
ncbi:MAG: Flp pilus assembly protein CpaB [Xanthobacteraceae bacterium]|jgi:pilus assembly protein CpaB